MSDRITPGSVHTTFWRWFGTGIFAVIVIGVITFAGWQAGWWFSNQNASREAHQIRSGYSNQQTLREQITTQIANVGAFAVQIDQAAGDQQEIGDLWSQRVSVANIACQDIDEVTGDPLPADQAAWGRANCQEGSISPASPYALTNEGN